MRNCGDCYYFQSLGMGKHGRCYAFPANSLIIVHDNDKNCSYYAEFKQILLPFGETPSPEQIAST